VSADELAHDREETTNEGYRYDGDEHQLRPDLHTSGSTNAPTGPARPPAQHCYSTGAAAG
jgi:hypothetical protein